MLQFNKTKHDYAVFEIKQSGCLLSTRQQDFLNELIDFIMKLNKTPELKLGLIFAPVALSDYESYWLAELRESAYVDTLFKRICRFQYTLNSLRDCQKPLIFAATQDCLGSFYELAYSCDYIMALNPDSQWGWPDLATELFPYGLSLQWSRRPRIKNWGLLQNSAVTSSIQAQSLGIIDYIIEEDDGFPKWLDNWISTELPVFDPETVTTYPQDFWGKINKLQDHCLRYSFELTDEKKFFPESLSLWQGYRDYITKNPKLSPEFMIASAHKAAEYLGQDRYQISVNRKKLFAISQPERAELTVLDPPILHVNLNNLAPPHRCLLRLLSQSCQLIFFAHDPVVLKQGLDLCASRMATQSWNTRQDHSWLQHVFWQTAPQNMLSQQIPCLTFKSDDYLYIDWKNEQFSFYRFAGNRGSAEAGWMEYTPKQGSSARYEHQFLQLALMTCEGLIRSKSVGDISLTRFIRFLFLEEIFALSLRSKGTAKILTALENHGWGCIAQDNFWEHFFRTRPDLEWDPHQPPPNFAQLSIDPEVWALNVWREARLKAKKRASREPLSPLAISLHFVFLTAFIYLALKKNKVLSNEDELERLVELAGGYPETLPTIRDFISQTPRGKMSYYARHYLPKFAEMSNLYDEGQSHVF